MDNSISIIAGIRDLAHKFIEKEFEKRGIKGLVTSHGEILIQLMKHGELSKSEIASRIGRKKATVTTLINKLDKIGFIKQEKLASDNRYTMISLTVKGKEFKKDITEISKQIYATEYIDINEEEKKIFLSVIEKIYENFFIKMNPGDSLPKTRGNINTKI